MARRYQKTGSRPAVRYLGLMSGLFVLVVLAAVFTVAVVQIQSGAAAYLAGQSIWSRGQVKTVLYLDAYAETGDPAMLARARRWHDIPLGDIQARKAMEAAPFDYDTAREGFLRGRIHPSDIPRLITLFRFFSQAPYFRDAVSAWQQSDQQILALGEIADQLESEWRAEEVALLRVKELRTELDRASRKLDHHALEFRRSMTRLARLMPTALSLASVVFFILFGVLAMTLTSRLTRALRDSERKFRATFEQAGMGIAQVAEDGRLLEVNQALCDILRYSRAELLKLSYPDLMHPEDKENGDEGPFTAISEAFQNHAIEQSLLCGDGSTVWAKLTVSRLQEQSGPQVCYIAIFEDVSESRRLSAELSYQASHDELTGLINRRAFERYLEDFLYRAHNDGSVHALCFIDLDQFKIINDTSGHFVGDYLLRQVAEAFSHHIRKGDLLARLGGDEFALILEHCDPDTAMTVAEKLRKSLIETTFA
ncbi:MAG: diguanylate cyclase domain-containing protein, partial [Thiohalophilus sp.]